MKTKHIICPRCGADAGTPCKNLLGMFVRSHHQEGSQKAKVFTGIQDRRVFPGEARVPGDRPYTAAVHTSRKSFKSVKVDDPSGRKV